MTRRIFFVNMISVLLTATISSLVLTLVTYQKFIKAETTKIESQTQLISQGITAFGMEYLHELDTKHDRVVWINPQGNIIFDTHPGVTPPENYSNREEVQTALVSGIGLTSGKGDTIVKEIIFYAKQLPDGSIINLTSHRETLLGFFLSILQPILVLFLLGGLFATFISFCFARRITKPLLSLDSYHTLENVEIYEEIVPLLTQIQKQYQKIDRQIEEMSRRQEEFDIITRDMEEGLLLLNQDEQILSINDSASQLFETNREESLGKNILTIHRSLDMQQLLEKAFHGDRGEGLLTLSNQVYQITASPIIQDKEVSGVAVLLVNATEKSELEQMQREFTANVSHELKTPLHSISGCAELLSHNLVKSKDVPEFATQIYNETQRLIRLVDEIISLSRLDEGAVNFNTEEVDMGSIVKEVCFHLEDMAKESNLSFHLTTTQAMMTGSYTLLSGLLRNLCENSIKYNKQQGSVEVIVENYDNFVRVQVNDTGIGISEKDKQLIFQRFYRVDKSRSKEIGGTGLGLSIVKHIVALHQGKLTIESELDMGTSIQIDFPKKQ